MITLSGFRCRMKSQYYRNSTKVKRVRERGGERERKRERERERERKRDR